MRRANGTGSISKMPPGRRARYSVRVTVPGKPDEQRQMYLGYYATLKEAQEALEAYRATGKAPGTGPTLADVYDKWSERKYARASEAVKNKCTAAWKRMEDLADAPIADLRTDDLQDFIDRLSESYSGSTIASTKSLLGQLWKYALEHDFVAKDYTQFIQMPAIRPKFEKGAFSEEQIAHLKELAASGFPWADTALILCYTGFRISALLQMTEGAYHPDGDYLQGGVKTEAGKNRIVPVHPVIAPYLARRIAEHGPRIVCRDGEPITIDYFGKKFKPIARELGVEAATPHWCRHTMASRLRMAGAPDLAVKRIMGHSNKDVTDHYTHTDVEYLRQAILLLV